MHKTGKPSIVDLILFILFLCQGVISRALSRGLDQDVTITTITILSVLFLLVFVYRLAHLHAVDLFSLLLLVGTVLTLV